ncbi:Enoyl-(Acyl carrier protein) reductase [Oceanobacillus limi]|uniref:Enoyl-(Acyl carrier protein) reductase n=1 Tax=Oceanobacillus limi TaxID=930131 RepID=A0A1I0FI94_9BACI|nr:Enoyl-(Acyl carrier protein) reductase [Oceanobacillus limi]
MNYRWYFRNRILRSGVITLTKCVAQEYGNLGIRVNALTPDAIHTPMIESKFSELLLEKAIKFV